MSKALVTGGAGFIGSNIARLLVEQGYEVVVLDNLSTGHRQNLEGLDGLSFVEGDVRDDAAVARAIDGAEVVFHLAASVGNVRSIENPFEDSRVNVLGTLTVLEAARKAAVRKIVCSSSAAIFGELKRLPIDEAHPTEPDSPYGVSKLAQEKHCLAYARLHGIEAICLRYFNVYGRNQRFDAYGNVIPIFVDRMLSGEPLTIFGDGEQTRDFVEVTDVARVNFLAAQTTGISGAFNIGTGEAITINQLVQLLSEATGKKLNVEHLDERKGEVRHSRADISAARATLGFEPQVLLPDGLAAYWEWARKEFR